MVHYGRSGRHLTGEPAQGVGILYPLLLVLLVAVAAVTGVDAHATVAAIASTLR